MSGWDVIFPQLPYLTVAYPCFERDGERPNEPGLLVLTPLSGSELFRLLANDVTRCTPLSFERCEWVGSAHQGYATGRRGRLRSDFFL